MTHLSAASLDRGPNISRETQLVKKRNENFSFNTYCKQKENVEFCSAFHIIYIYVCLVYLEIVKLTIGQQMLTYVLCMSLTSIFGHPCPTLSHYTTAAHVC